MVDSLYQPFHQKSRDLEFKMHDLLNTHGHPQATVLREEVRRLTEDFEQRKNPRTIEDRVKTIQRQLMQAQHQGQNLTSVEHTRFLYDNFERMRRDLRNHPHY